MLSILVLIPMFAPVPEPDPAEQKALAALEEVGFRAELADKKSRQVKELSYSGFTLDGKELPTPTDKDLANLAALPNLEKLLLRGRFTNDDTLDHIRSPVLRERWLQGADVTDTGLKKLAKFKKLAILTLAGTNITDAGIKTLASLPSLRHLDLQGTSVTDKGLKALEKSPIRTFHLGGTEIGDAGISSLAKMPALYGLSLRGTKVTDKGLKEMAGAGAFPKLVSLDLGETAVADEGIKALHDPKALPSLRGPTLSNSHVSAAGVKALRDARPKPQITWDP